MWNIVSGMCRTVQRLLESLGSAPGRVHPRTEPGTRIPIGLGEDAVSRLAVLVCRAVAKSSEPLRADQVRLLPAREILSDREAAAHLARMEKPLQCTVSVSRGLLEIACQPLGPEGEWIMTGKTAIAKQNGGWLGMLEYEAKESSGSKEIAIIGRNEFAVVPYDVAERFERDYVLLNSYTMVGDVPERFGIQAAATARWYTPSSSKTRVRSERVTL